jgi:hypothetical protein
VSFAIPNNMVVMHPHLCRCVRNTGGHSSWELFGNRMQGG